MGTDCKHKLTLANPISARSWQKGKAESCISAVIKSLLQLCIGFKLKKESLQIKVTRLILHIGSAKTGTTSIQKSLMINRNTLRKFEVCVPITLGETSYSANHRWLAQICRGTNYSDDVLHGIELNTKSSRERKYQELTAKFIKECRDASSKCQYFVMSSEHLSMVRKVEDLQYMHSLLANLFDDLTIIYYIRDPLKAAISMLSTQIKAGQSPDFLKKPEWFPTGDHWQCISGYKKHFRGARFIIRRFERKHLKNGDVVTDFYDQCLPQIRTDSLKFPKEENKTLSLSGMKLLTKLNKELPRFTNNRYIHQKIKNIVINATNDGSLYLPCMEEYQAYEDYFKESLEKMRLEFYPDETRLFSQQSKFSDKKIDLSEFDLNKKKNQEILFHVLRNYIEFIEKTKAGPILLS